MEEKQQNVIEVGQLIDLTDKPVELDRDQIGWARVRSSASNCICCCINNSITLVTTESSYTLDRIPLDEIRSAQASPNLQYLAMSNEHKLAIIELVDSRLSPDLNNNHGMAVSMSHLRETRLVDLAGQRLSMHQVTFWRWLDDTTLAILSHDSLYTCQVDQVCIKHPAQSALSNSVQLLAIERIFDIHEHLSDFCQITDVYRDPSTSLYAISSLYSAGSLGSLSLSSRQFQTSNGLSHGLSLRPSFGSMPSRLSQLAHNNRSFDSLRFDLSNEQPPARVLSSTRSSDNSAPTTELEICGFVQVFCALRQRSQLIQAHAVSFTSIELLGRQASVMVAANKVGPRMRVHFVEMATPDNSPSSASLNVSATCRFNKHSEGDFPTYIVCSHVPTGDSSAGKLKTLHLAMVVTKHGQLFICSVMHGTILFNTSIINDTISSAVLDNKTQGLSVVCRNGQVLLIRPNVEQLVPLLNARKSMRCTSPAYESANATGADAKELLSMCPEQPHQNRILRDTGRPHDIEVLTATRL